MTDWLIAASSIVTSLVAIGAFVVAKRAPRAAAKFADEFRKDSVPIEEREKLKTQVLLALLKGRSQLMHPDTVAALNIVDFVFHDDSDVRSKYRVFVEDSFGSNAETLVTRYRELTSAVARSMGYGETITDADMRLGYYPIALGKIDESTLAEAEEKLARRDAQRTSGGSGNIE